MNKVIQIGRLTADPEVRYSQGNEPVCIAKYRLAVNRKFKRDGEPDADFISCVAFGKQGEFAEKYLRKGTKIAITGRIQTGSYTNKEGQKVYTTDIVVEEHEFVESKGDDRANDRPKPQNDSNEFMSISDDLPELPFN